MNPHPSRFSRWNNRLYLSALLLAVFVFALGTLERPNEGEFGLSVAVHPARSHHILL